MDVLENLLLFDDEQDKSVEALIRRKKQIDIKLPEVRDNLMSFEKVLASNVNQRLQDESKSVHFTFMIMSLLQI